MRINMQALGCRLNEAELETWSRQFAEAGHQLSPDNEAADLLVVNSCAVTQEAVRKSRKLVRRMQRLNPAAKLVISGCYASLEKADALKALGVDLIIPNQHKDELVARVCRELIAEDMPAIATEPAFNALFSRGRQRAFIKVQDGCRYRCTFCIVTHARGEERSRPVADIIQEINHLSEQGVREAVLTGVHIGGYGSDINSNLHKLVATLLAETDIERLRMGSVEPWDLPAEFFSLFDNPRFMPHLHLPLQSGADSVLRRMARRCKTADYRQLLKDARTAVAGINITTDIIVGFPGETESEWQQTLDYVNECAFGHLHIFSYSPREGTKAAGLAHQIERPVKRERSQQLHELGHYLKQQHLQKQLGQTVKVLLEEPLAEDPARYWAYTPNFSRIAVQCNDDSERSNAITHCRIQACSDDANHLQGKAIAP
ncbi:MAG: tRNA (N(6)-L-threonylcarbamoyladenosine(37)-C(2))-methylthiotransferase MtaB [gamma proteobacterium symbiont of Bathyaustriella thionipta]|nr:tRNA (N(6)-L-threonylcarbamoyladenosine(37)-C(2))-methylthiotransferase MtaB [gamma proteobacterium symbiont of Bathyaustriella thionipta]